MAKALMIDIDGFKRYTTIDGEVEAAKLKPLLHWAQDAFIEEVLGSSLYDKITADIVAGTLAGNYLTLVTDHIQPVLAHLASGELIKTHAFKIGQRGIVKSVGTNEESVSVEEINLMSEACFGRATNYLDALKRHLRYYASTRYPEFYDNQNDDINPQDPDSYGGSNLEFGI